MRGGDFVMLERSFNYIYQKRFQPKPLQKLTLDQLLSYADTKEALKGELAGHDAAPHPNILIDFQASLSFTPYNYDKHTTKALSEFIWFNSSVINVRNLIKREISQEDKEMLKTITNIQMYLVKPSYYKIDLEPFQKQLSKYRNKKTILAHHSNKKKIKHVDSRLGFLLLFGQKISVSVTDKKKNTRYDVVVAGTEEQPCRIKSVSKTESNYLEGRERYLAELAYVKMLSETPLELDCPKPPVGYRWIWGQKKKIRLSTKLISTNENSMTSKIVFLVDDHELQPFDTSNILEHLQDISTQQPFSAVVSVIKQALYYNNNNTYDDFEINLLMRKLSELLFPSFEWYNLAVSSQLPATVWKCVVVKLFNNYNSEVQVGPVDGMGNKLHDSINYLHEGTILRVFNMLSMIYPNTVIPSTPLKFFINTESNEYLDMITKLKVLAFPVMTTKDKKYKQHIPKQVKITTKLWEHQKKTSDKILDDILINQKFGFGDASNVGAGKTLTALSVITGLYNYNMKHTKLNYAGFLVLLPTTYLYNTWLEEIRKHTQGLDTVTQNADGSLTSDIKHNTVLITTLGRMRDHPLSQPWILVIIDECLSVQNKNALQTEEAWRQIICSQYRCILLSATFFRSRFDKLFYMLKMLGTGLPENKSYLDTILSEHIISYLPTKVTEWKSHVNRYNLPGNLRKEYDQLLKLELNSEKLYSKLASFLYDMFDYVGAFSKIVKSAQKKGRRCLLYARSKEEADDLASGISGVTRFPDTSGQHLAISYTEGTYGLNHLVYLSTIVTRPPEPDKLPQMKGRLDRPGQKSKYLFIEYLVVDNTVEEASLFRLELANSFFNNYILPLADFYDVAVGKKSSRDFLVNDTS